MLHPRKPVAKFKGEPVFLRVYIQEAHTKVSVVPVWCRFRRRKLHAVCVTWLGVCAPRTWQRYWYRRCARIVEEAELDRPVRSMERKMRDTKQVVELMLYGKWQTRKHTPPPVVAGVIPTNEHGAKRARGTYRFLLLTETDCTRPK